MMIAIPLIWLVLFGYAFSFDVDEITVAVVDLSGTEVGARVAQTVRSYERFRVVDLAEATAAGIDEAFYRDAVQMAVLLPEGFGRPGSDGRIRVLIDGSDLFASQAGARLIAQALEPVTAGRAMAPEVQILYNPDLKSAPVMIPGLLGMVVMFMTTMMTAMGVVREREYGTMEQLVVTPIRPFELMLGKIIPYFFVGMIDFALVFVAGIYLFDLEFAGNLPLFLGLSLLLVLTTLGLGLLLSTVAQNQQQAMQMAMMVVMPQVLVSGMIFPLSSLPEAIRYIAYALPFTHYVPIAQGMFIKGQGLDLLWLPATVLAIYAVAVVTLASIRFRKRLG